MPIGRNVDEMLRVVDALQFTEEYGEVCPAGWQKGEKGMKPTADGVSDYLEANAEKLQSNKWYKWFKTSMTIFPERSMIPPLNALKKG